jgi:hypothetical protein
MSSGCATLRARNNPTQPAELAQVLSMSNTGLSVSGKRHSAPSGTEAVTGTVEHRSLPGTEAGNSGTQKPTHVSLPRSSECGELSSLKSIPIKAIPLY